MAGARRGGGVRARVGSCCWLRAREPAAVGRGGCYCRLVRVGPEFLLLDLNTRSSSEARADSDERVALLAAFYDSRRILRSFERVLDWRCEGGVHTSPSVGLAPCSIPPGKSTVADDCKGRDDGART
jgi:hypothetical protein